MKEHVFRFLLILFVFNTALYCFIGKTQQKPKYFVQKGSNATVRGSALNRDPVCSDMIYEKWNESQPYNTVPDMTTDRDVLHIALRGCSYLKDHYSFPASTDHITQLEYENPIAYSLLVHKNTEQLLILLSAIYAPQNVYCIHIDKKAPDDMVSAIKTAKKCFPNMFLATKREDILYAGFSRLQADINCMEDLLNVPVNMYDWKYLINLCGQDFPLSTNLEIVQQICELKNRNVIGGDANPSEAMRSRTKYVHMVLNQTLGDGSVAKHLVKTETLKSPPPFDIPVRKNLAYNVYTRSFLHWVVFESEKAKALLNWSRDTATPDEHYWLMLDALEEAPGRTGRISWFQLSRYIVWKSSSTPCRGFWRHYSCVFGAGDLEEMVRHGVFFANKFETSYDSLPVTCLRKWLDDRRLGRNDARNPNRVPQKIYY